MNNLTQRVYDYLNTNALGEQNGISQKDLAAQFNVSDRQIRNIKHNINCSDKFDNILSTCDSDYTCQNQNEYDKAILNTYKTGFSYIQKARCMEKKAKKLQHINNKQIIKRKLKIFKLAIHGLKKNKTTEINK